MVEGLITDQPGPYVVKISKAKPVTATDQFDKPIPVSDASVIIHDDEGNIETLTENSSGNYYTSVFQGVIGRTYSITITTKEGSVYQSSPEKLLPVGDFTNLRYEFVQNESTDANMQITSTNGFTIFLDSEVLPEQEERVWWRWTGTFEILTYPHRRLKLYISRPPMEPQVFIPDPAPCSGYTVDKPDLLSTKLVGPLADCQCCTCWVTQYNSRPLISDLKFISNGKINKLNIAFIEANRRTFYDKYYLEIEQLNPSEVIYNFWKNVKIQKGNSSNLFQIPPPKAVGNIFSTTPNSIPAIGYFAASALKKHSIVITREDVPYRLRLIDTLSYSCVEAYKYSSTKKPSFW